MVHFVSFTKVNSILLCCGHDHIFPQALGNLTIFRPNLWENVIGSAREPYRVHFRNHNFLNQKIYPTGCKVYKKHAVSSICIKLNQNLNLPPELGPGIPVLGLF